MEEMLFESGGDSRFARCGETGEPEGEAMLSAKGVALGSGEGGVPGDISVKAQRGEGSVRYMAWGKVGKA